MAKVLGRDALTDQGEDLGFPLRWITKIGKLDVW
jgi:hypothetical protein